MRTIFVPIVVVLLAAPAFAQELFPDAVTRCLSAETLVVIRVDLESLDPAAAGVVLGDWADPAGPLEPRARSLDQALRDLKRMQAGAVFFVLGMSDLPLDGVMIVADAGKPVIDALKAVWPDDVDEVAGGAVAGSRAARMRLRSRQPVARPEFADALQSLPGTGIAAAIAPGADARRVLREFLPELPVASGGELLTNVVETTSWLALGASLPPRLEIRLVTQTSSPAVAQSQQQLIATTLATLATDPQVRNLVPRTGELRALLTPRVDGSRLILSLAQDNDAARRVVDDIAKPLVERARSNARRSRTVANLKQLGLAMHMYHDAHKTLPPAASRSKDGLARLSWRVLVLPYLDRKDLYDQFHLDEPWDSEHNRRLIERMPAVFDSGSSSTEQKRRGMTTYLVPTGDKTVFGSPVATRIRDIRDGTSNTIMIVDALSDRAVVWTRPDDLPFDPRSPWNGVAIPPMGDFWCTFCDGSVRRLDGTESVENLRRYFQMNDGEVITPR